MSTDCYTAPKRSGHTIGANSVHRYIKASTQELATLAHVAPKLRSISNSPADVAPVMMLLGKNSMARVC